MKIMMIKSAKGISRADGAGQHLRGVKQQYEGTEDWEINVLGGFVRMGVANEIGGNAGPTETKKKAAPKKRQRQRNKHTEIGHEWFD